MAEAKKVLGDVCCIGGNLSIATLSVGTPEDVKNACKKLINDCAKGGSYVMLTGATVDKVPPANIKMMIDATKEFGVYK